MAAYVKVILLLTFLGASVCFADLLTSEQLQKLDEYIAAVMACRNVPGLTLAVVQGDQVLTRAYGKTDLEKHINATTDSIFCIGSVTKAMTTALLSKFVPLKFPQSLWDTKLKDILGESFKLNNDDITNESTLKDILCHRMGVALGDVPWISGYPKSLTRNEAIKRLRFLPAVHPFRYTAEYNNWMFSLGGHVAEHLADGDESWEDLMNKHIFQALAMDSTVFVRDLNKQPEERVGLPYLNIDGDYHLLSTEIFGLHPVESAGAVCSTGNDMSKWLQLLLQTGRVPPWEDIVNATAMKATTEPYELLYLSGANLYRPTFPVDHVVFGYGLGWLVASYRGRHQVWHGGSVFGHTSLLWTFPDLKTGIFVSTNCPEEGFFPAKFTILYYLSHLLFGEDPWLNSTTACTFPAPWRMPLPRNTANTATEVTPVSESKRPLEEYIGVYGNQFYGDVHISVNDSELLLRLGHNLQGSLFPTEQKDIFTWEITGIFWFLTTQNPNDIFYFYTSDGGKVLNSLNVTMLGEFIHFDRGVKFDDTSSSVICFPSYLVYMYVLFALRLRIYYF